MQPTVSRIVHVIVDPATNGGQDHAPAIITRVWGPNCVNVRVFRDADPDGTPDRLTSLPLFESREELEARQTGPGAKLFGAFWPPRAEHQPGDRTPRY